MEELLTKYYAGGEIELARPLAPGVDRLRLNDPTFSDLAGVLTGMKPVTYTDCAVGRVAALRELCGKLKLECLPAEEFLDKRWHHLRRGKALFFIGRGMPALRKAALAWQKPGNNENWAGMLGYPRCCIELYSKWLKQLGRGPDLVELAYANTPRKTGLYFGLNNVFNFSSRINSKFPADAAAFERFTLFNRERIFNVLHVIGWHPCSYSCRESAKKAGVIYSFMRHHAPAYAGALAAALAKPVLFWGKFEFAFIDGELRGGRIISPAVSWPRSLLPDEVYKGVASAGEIRARGGKVSFLKDGSALALPAPKCLLDFKAPAGRSRS